MAMTRPSGLHFTVPRGAGRGACGRPYGGTYVAPVSGNSNAVRIAFRIDRF
jgi:hypothetical protein